MKRVTMTGELAFFEIGVADTARARTFYGSLFGWHFEPGPSGNGFGITAPNMRGGMHGGDAGAAPYVFFEVDDMETALDRVRDLGGDVEEMDVEGDEESIARFGRFKLCRDDQGSHFGLHQPPSHSRAETDLAQKEEATTAVKPVREGFHTVTPYLMVKEAERLIDFVKQAFGATELLRTTGSARGMHAEVGIGDSTVMIGGGGAWSGEPMPAATIYLYMNDVDAVYEHALQASATPLTEPADQPYGDRMAGVQDPFGNVWYIATHKEDVPL